MSRLLTGLIVTVCSLSGCSLLPDHSLDYRQAKDLPALKFPEGQDVRPPQPLYVIPDVQPARFPVVLTERDGKKEKFAIPSPAPLAIAAAVVVEGKDGVNAAGHAVSRPRLVADGNGSPLLQVDGDPEQVWDTLNRALVAGKIRIDDRNQSLGVYYLKLATEGAVPDLQLKVTRTPGTSILSLQLNEDTVADADVARQLFAKLLESWPG